MAAYHPHGDSTPAGYSGGSVEKYHCPLHLSSPSPEAVRFVSAWASFALSNKKGSLRGPAGLALGFHPDARKVSDECLFGCHGAWGINPSTTPLLTFFGNGRIFFDIFLFFFCAIEKTPGNRAKICSQTSCIRKINTEMKSLEIVCLCLCFKKCLILRGLIGIPDINKLCKQWVKNFFLKKRRPGAFYDLGV